MTVPEKIRLIESTLPDGEVINLGEAGLVDRGPLERFTRIVGFKFDEIAGMIRALSYLIDVDNVDSDLLPYLGATLGVEFNKDVDIMRRREEIKEAVAGYKIKGTIPGTELVARKIMNMDTTLWEFRENIMFANRVPRLLELGAAKVAAGGVLGPVVGTKVYVDTLTGFAIGDLVGIQYRSSRFFAYITNIGTDADGMYLTLTLPIPGAVRTGDSVLEVAKSVSGHLTNGTVLEYAGISLDFNDPKTIYLGLPTDYVGYSYGKTFANEIEPWAGTASASTEESGYPARCAAGADQNDEWRSTGGAPQSWLFDFGEDPGNAKNLTEIGIYPTPYGVQDFVVGVSNNGISYRTVAILRYGTRVRKVLSGTIQNQDAVPYQVQLDGGGIAETPVAVIYYVSNAASLWNKTVAASEAAGSQVYVTLPEIGVGEWIQLRSSAFSFFRRVTAVGTGSLTVDPPLDRPVPIGTEVRRVSLTALTPASVDRARGIVSLTDTALVTNDTIVLDGYAAAEDLGVSTWKFFSISPAPGAFRYWRILVKSTWGANPGLVGVVGTEEAWPTDPYTCEKFGLFFTVPCDWYVPTDEECIDPVPDCVCAAPFGIEGPTVLSEDAEGTWTVAESCCCGCGSALEYQFDWGETPTARTAWLASPSAAHTFVNPGTYYIRARTRCSGASSCVSPWSEAVVVVVSSVAPPTVVVHLARITDATPGAYRAQYVNANGLPNPGEPSFFVSLPDEPREGPWDSQLVVGEIGYVSRNDASVDTVVTFFRFSCGGG